MAVGVEALVVDEVGSVCVDERVEAQAVAPTRREVVDLSGDMRIPAQEEGRTNK